MRGAGESDFTHYRSMKKRQKETVEPVGLDRHLLVQQWQVEIIWR
jgi:hypothetical protein